MVCREKVGVLSSVGSIKWTTEVLLLSPLEQLNDWVASSQNVKSEWLGETNWIGCKEDIDGPGALSETRVTLIGPNSYKSWITRF